MYEGKTENLTALTGQLKKIRVQKEDGWGVFIVKYVLDDVQSECAFTGVMPRAKIGSSYDFAGSFVSHRVYGHQFKFVSCIPVEDTSADGVFALLSSKRFKGVGPKKAQAIVERFGEDTLRIIREEPLRLTEIKGISDKTAMSIKDQMPDLGVWERLRMMLSGATDATVTKIYEKYGTKSIEVLKKNPYTLIKDVEGVGFIKADAIAANLGITGDHPLRVQAAIYHCLDRAAEQNGHCYSYATNLQTAVEEIIPGVDVAVIADAIKEMTDPSFGRMQLFVDDDGAIYLNYLYTAEKGCANAVRTMLTIPPDTRFTAAMVDKAALTILHETGIDLEPTQRNAVLSALNNPLCIITGGPGTGKTTIIRTLIKVINNNSAMLGAPQIALMAPTGRASRRMFEATGHDAHTMHSYLGISESSSGSCKHLDYDFIIIDEASMIDIQLAYKLFHSIDPRKTHVILIGDADQLPPVGPGIFFIELIRNYRVPTVRLKFSFRQAGSIAQNAEKINNGMGTHALVQDKDFVFVKADKDAAPGKAINIYLEMCDKYGVNDTVMLSPKKAGNCGTIALNQTIQQIMNPLCGAANGIKTYDYLIAERDRVMLTKNNVVEGHANGDVGTVASIDGNVAIVQFDNDPLPSEMELSVLKNNFILAYVSTIHKSQGSEYKGVVLLFTSEHMFMGERALLYTGITRAKTQCALIGDARAINSAIGKVKPITRNSKLNVRINA